MQHQANLTELRLSATQADKLGIPFAVRNASELKKNLLLNAAPKGFVHIPIYTYIEASKDDGPVFDNCNYAHTSKLVRVKNHTNYDQYNDLQKFLSTAYADDGFKNDQNETLDESYFQNLDFLAFEKYSDAIQAERWNMHPQKHNFTEKELYDLNTTINVHLTIPYTDYAR